MSAPALCSHTHRPLPTNTEPTGRDAHGNLTHGATSGPGGVGPGGAAAGGAGARGVGAGGAAGAGAGAGGAGAGNGSGILVPAGSGLDLRTTMPSTDIPFEQRPALLRHPWGMAYFAALDASLSAAERAHFLGDGGEQAHLGLQPGQGNGKGTGTEAGAARIGAGAGASGVEAEEQRRRLAEKKARAWQVLVDAAVASQQQHEGEQTAEQEESSGWRLEQAGRGEGSSRSGALPAPAPGLAAVAATVAVAGRRRDGPDAHAQARMSDEAIRNALKNMRMQGPLHLALTTAIKVAAPHLQDALLASEAAAAAAAGSREAAPGSAVEAGAGTGTGAGAGAGSSAAGAAPRAPQADQSISSSGAASPGPIHARINGKVNGFYGSGAAASSSSTGLNGTPMASTPVASAGAGAGGAGAAAAGASPPQEAAGARAGAKGKARQVETYTIPSPLDAPLLRSNAPPAPPASSSSNSPQKGKGASGQASGAASASAAPGAGSGSGSGPGSSQELSSLISSWWDSVAGGELIANGAPALPVSEQLAPEAALARHEAFERAQRARKRKWDVDGKRAAKAARVDAEAGESPQQQQQQEREREAQMRKLHNKVPQTLRALEQLRRTDQRLGALMHANAVSRQIKWSATSLRLLQASHALTDSHPIQAGEAAPDWALNDTDEEEGAEEVDQTLPIGASEPVSRAPSPGPFGSAAIAANPNARVSAECARESFLYASRMLMAKQGLNGSHRAPMQALANMGIEIIANIGRTLRNYSDRYGQKLAPEEMIKHALQEVANVGVADLETYVRARVERHHARVEELLRKVKTAYEIQSQVSAVLAPHKKSFRCAAILAARLTLSTLQASTDRRAVEHEALFADGGEGLIAGSFADEVGDDFFGFKELGLDLGIQSLAVPTRLFRGMGGRPGAGVPGAGGINGIKGPAEENIYPPPPPFVPLDSAGIASQIGLLQPFFKEKMREHKRSKSRAKEEVHAEEMDTLPDEDEAITAALDSKKTTRVAPTGKLPARRLWAPPSAAAAKAKTQPAANEKPSTATSGTGKKKADSRPSAALQAEIMAL